MARKSRKQVDAIAENTLKTKVFSTGAYVRLSVLDTNKKGDSIETQQVIYIGCFSGLRKST